MNLTTSTKVTLVQAPLATGSASTGLMSSVIDTQNHHGCMFVGTLGTAATTDLATLAVYESSASAGTYAALSGMTASSSANEDDKVFIVDVSKPCKRYLKARLVRTANVEYGGTVAIQYEPDSKPTTHASSTLASAAVLGVSPTT